MLLLKKISQTVSLPNALAWVSYYPESALFLTSENGNLQAFANDEAHRELLQNPERLKDIEDAYSLYRVAPEKKTFKNSGLQFKTLQNRFDICYLQLPEPSLLGHAPNTSTGLSMGIQSFSRQELWDIITYQQKVFGLVAHDLRSPLSTLQTYLNFVLQGSDLNEFHTKVFERLQVQTDDMGSLIDELLTWARTSMQYQSQYQNVLLKDFGQQFLKHFESDAESSDIKLRLKPTPQTHQQFNTLLVKNCLRNFVKNSLQHTPAGGEVSLAIQEAQKFTHFIIEDTGSGLPEKVLDALAEGSHLPKGGDDTHQVTQGMGLKLCNALVKKEGGSIRLSNLVNAGQKVCGTRAELILPHPALN